MTDEAILLTWTQIFDRVMSVGPSGKKVFGLPKGGIIVAGLLEICRGCLVVDQPHKAEVIVLDVVDTGRTKKVAEEMFPRQQVWALYPHKEPGTWFHFPWEMPTEPKKEKDAAV